MSDEVELNAGQVEAIQRVMAWVESEDPNKPRTFFLSGPAGSGKTSIAKDIAHQVHDLPPIFSADKKSAIHGVVVVAPTGKAASRLREKKLPGAKTLHSVFYDFVEEDANGEPIFAAKSASSSAIKPRLIILDEASMVKMAERRVMEEYGLILAIGDVNQLPPVKEGDGLQARAFTRPDYKLTEIVRTAKDSHIVGAAGFAKDGKIIFPEREYDDVRIRGGRYVPDEDLIDHAANNATIICQTNDMRRELNGRLRHLLGYETAIPAIGEKVVCLRNQPLFQISNGDQGVVLGYIPAIITDPDKVKEVRRAWRDARRERNAEYRRISDMDDRVKLLELGAPATEANEKSNLLSKIRQSRLDLKDLDTKMYRALEKYRDTFYRVVLEVLGKEMTAEFNVDSFSDDATARKEAQKSSGGFDYGYALTVWKAQGSEWSRVLFVEGYRYSSDHHKLVYTAITRARDQLTMYPCSVIPKGNAA